MLILVDELTYKELEPAEFKQLLKVYEYAMNQLKNVIRPENVTWLVKWFEEEHRRWMLHTFVHELAIPYSVFIAEKPSNSEEQLPTKSKPLPKDPEFEEQVMHHLPTCRKEEVLRSIIHFTMCRSVFTRYLESLHRLPTQTDKHAFDESYSFTFNQALQKWKPHTIYQFENRHMIECRQQPQDRKLKATTALLIVEDEHNFVLVEPSKENSEGTIILNIRYKGIEPEILKDDPRLLSVKWANDLTHG